MRSSILLIDGDATAAAVIRRFETLPGLDISVTRCGLDEPALRDGLENLSPALAVFGPSVPDAIHAARLVHRLSPHLQMVFLVGDEAHRLLRALGLAPRIGINWSSTSLEATDLAQIVERGMRASQQRQKTRTQITEINARRGAGNADDPRFKALMMSERFIDALLENTADAIFTTDIQGKVITWNRGAERVFGYGDADLDDRQVSLLRSDFERLLFQELHSAAGEGQVSRQLMILHRSGEERTLDFSFTPLRDERGQAVAISWIARDVTARLRAEQRRDALIRLTDLIKDKDQPNDIAFAGALVLGEALKVARVGYAQVAPGGNAVTIERQWNAPGCVPLPDYIDLTHYGTFVCDLQRGQTVVFEDAATDHRTAAVVDRLASVGARAIVNVPVMEKGEWVALLFLNNPSVRTWHDDELLLIREVAERTRAAAERARNAQALQQANETLELKVQERTHELMQTEAALRQAQKMEAVGQLTGGIAHDFNNMLAVVMGSLDLLSRRLAGEDARTRHYVTSAMEGAKRAANLTQRLLAFSRQQPLQPKVLDPNRLVGGMSDLLTHSLGGTVRLETVLAAGIWAIDVDPNQLENVLLNLAVNARDAMPDGGRLTIETQNAYLDDHYVVNEPGVAAGQYVLIAVSDTGTGMSDEVIAKAFDPFFTTKEVGKGTGLGLSQVYGFVRQSEGHVKIYSEPGHGTSIKIYLPRAKGDPGAMSTGKAEESPGGDDKEVVLVVDDEDLVRQFTADSLTELGYRVLEANGAISALETIRTHPEIVLLFTDVVMPEVNGAKLANEVRALRPDIKILYTTGYTRNAIVHNGTLDPGVALIGKPFTIEELAAKVRQILDQP